MVGLPSTKNVEMNLVLRGCTECVHEVVLGT